MITKELQNKLVTRCQNPRTVVNKYTREPVVVSCGSCPSCILRRSGIQTNLLYIILNVFLIRGNYV